LKRGDRSAFGEWQNFLLELFGGKCGAANRKICCNTTIMMLRIYKKEEASQLARLAVDYLHHRPEIVLYND
jgi:hypothetical protein